MSYLLDTQVISYFLQARRENDLATAAVTVPCAIADEVAESRRNPTRGTLFGRWFPTSQYPPAHTAVSSAVGLVTKSVCRRPDICHAAR